MGCNHLSLLWYLLLAELFSFWPYDKSSLMDSVYLLISHIFQIYIRVMAESEIVSQWQLIIQNMADDNKSHQKAAKGWNHVIFGKLMCVDHLTQSRSLFVPHIPQHGINMAKSLSMSTLQVQSSVDKTTKYLHSKMAFVCYSFCYSTPIKWTKSPSILTFKKHAKYAVAL